jgi:urease accessory protein
LAGDHDRVEIVVESGTLAIEPVAACVALPGRRQTVLELDVTVGDGARLVLEDAPLVVAEGADVVRTTTIRLGEGATAVVRDLVVLGRAGEGRGRLESLLRGPGRADPPRRAADRAGCARRVRRAGAGRPRPRHRL